MKVERTDEPGDKAAIIISVDGPVVIAERATGVGMLELAQVGPERLLGEVIRLDGTTATIQVYESTTGLAPGLPVYGTGAPLSVELGPGMVGGIFDGVQRPLAVIQALTGDFVGRGVKIPPLDREKRWRFTPRLKAGDEVAAGQILGVVPETDLIEHRIMVPPEMSGKLVSVAAEGEYQVEDQIARINTDRGEQDLSLFQRWPVRLRRPYRARLTPSVPLITGQRVIDTFFPLAKGGTAAIPGGFGTGKTVTQHQLAKWADAQVIVYIGCGERGNEMAEVLQDFPHLIDPHTGRPLMERTILIANTSNMPVAAREASIYTGITIAEYYRDMGYDVALMADSTSRWAEALREIGGRLEEMPAEEGFPAYLPTRLAEFYERAGRVTTLGGSEGSVSVVGAVSPPGGAFTEPVTTHTQRFVRCFWALERDLASARHFPAINWLESYSEYVDEVQDWWAKEVDSQWRSMRDQAMALLQEEDRLQQIARLVGPDALPDEERLVLEAARLMRVAFLQQNATDPIDTYSTPARQVAILRLVLRFYDRGRKLVEMGVPILKLRGLPVVDTITRIRMSVPNEDKGRIEQAARQLEEQMNELEKEYL